ncbi:MAG TPA: amidohydrolase [Acidobacteria bacterium]|jgi:imidazolonepropionase-like amidohydrolase|nr:amidohydrolase [Acidobacteriota bacterium]HIN70592.1 amidohydrolase [Acidobacteriota bacterium]
MRNKGLLVIVGVLVASGWVNAQTRSDLSDLTREFVSVDAPVIALTDVIVIDGSGGEPRSGQTVVITDDRITAVGPSSEVEVPNGAEVLELSGHTVVPGLVGMHNHSYYTAAGGRAAQLDFSGPRIYLASGLTTIRTTGSRSTYAELNLKQAIESGQIPGPTLIVTGPYLTGGSGPSTMARLGDPEAARRVVRYWAEEGVTWFKAYTEIGRAELGAAIDEAHKLGVKVTAHLCSVTYREAVALGIDNLEHGLFANTDYVPNKEPDRCPPGFRRDYYDLDIDGPEVQATFREMIDNNVPMSSTLAVYEMSVPGRPPIDQRALDVLAPEVAEDVLAENKRYTERDPDDYGTSPAVFKKAMEYELAFFRAGGTLGAGVDPTGYGAALPGFGDQRNYELLIEAGFTPGEAIQVMSANGAKILGMDDSIGSIEVGKIADLAVIEADLAADPANIKKVVTVFKNGVGFDSAKLIASITGYVGVR